MTALLLQTPDVPLHRIIILSLVTLAVVTVGLVIVSRVKKRMAETDDDPAGAAAAGFSLSDLRRMHKLGQVSNEEFEKAKAKVIDAARRAAERAAATPGKNRDGAPPTA
jgi:hypothetical protein